MVTLILYDFLLIWTKNLGQTAQNIGGAESAPPRTIRRPKSPDFLGLKKEKHRFKFSLSLRIDPLLLPLSLWFIFNIFIHKWEKLNLQFSLVLTIHNAFQALNFDISKIKRVLDARILTKIKVLIEQKWPFCHFSLFLYSKKRQKFAHWIHLCKFVQKLTVHPQLSKG